MTSETAGPPAGQSPGEHPDVADQSAAGSGGAGQPPAAVDAGQPSTAGDAGPVGGAPPAV